MRPLLLHIGDSQYKAFLSYVRTLDCVSVDEGDDIPQWQQDEVARRLELIESGNMTTRSWDEASKDIFRKLGVLNHA
jgi:hypothetical protein